MYKARYYKADGKKGRARALPDSLFDGVVNESVLHQVVKVYRANQRQGTAAAKNRAAVAGGSRKPWRQKGTGRARQGTIRAAQWAGGGRAFPPIPHSWNQKVPRKVKALARRSAFNVRAEAERVVLVDGFEMERPRTAQLRDYLASIELGGGKVLILTDGLKETLYLSARNLPTVEVRPFGGEAPYDILWADTVVIERGALDRLGAEPATEPEPEAEPEPAPEAAVSAESEPDPDSAEAIETDAGSEDAESEEGDDA